MTSSVCRYLEKNEGDSGDSDVITYQIILESSSNESDFSDTESIESIQANTTVSAKDSSDISTDNISDYYKSEYELISSPDTIEPSMFDKDIFSSYSSSIPDMPVDSTRVAEDDDITDISEYATDALGSSPHLQFYRTCAQCFLPNSNPAFRFCDACYQSRKEFYTPKPFRRNKRKNNDLLFDLAPKKIKTSNDSDDAPSLPNSSESSGASVMPNSDAIASSQDSGFESVAYSSEWPNEKEKDKENCMACLTTIANGIFTHGKTAHRCCCYKCAKQVWHKTRRCPMCRRRIDKVIALVNF